MSDVLEKALEKLTDDGIDISDRVRNIAITALVEYDDEKELLASQISNNTKETHLRVKELEEALSETLRIVSMYVGRKNNPVYDDALKVLKNK